LVLLRKRKKKKLTTMPRKLVTVLDANSISSEQFRAIRTNIKFALPDKDLKTILVTSSMAGEGKSTSAANLAVVFAQEGKRVLIVDADMRKPTIHHTFEMYNTSGLSTVLTRQEKLHEVVQQSFIVGLDVIVSGPTPPNPTDLLDSTTMDMLMKEVYQDYDIIIFDAPPLLHIADAQILAHKCDGTLLVVDIDVVLKDDMLKAKTILTTARAKVLGVIMNNMALTRDHYYYQYSNNKK